MKKLLNIILIMCMPVYAQTSGVVVHNIMKTQIAPNAVPLLNIQSKTPVTEYDWNKLNQNLSSLHEAAHRLKKIDVNPEWQEHVDNIDKLAETSISYSKERNVPGLHNTGNALYKVCESCHQQFFPKGRNL
jgi:hypothetical protein